MSDVSIVFTVLALVVVLFVWNRLPVEVVAVGAALVLAATGVIAFPDAMAGFGDPTVVFIAALFVVSEGIDATGVTAWAGQQLVARSGDDGRHLTVLMLALVAVFTALISVNGAVAALLPMVVVVAVRTEQPPSRLLMPLAFGAHAGSLLALTGTPVHILVSDAARDAGEGGFGFFSFGLVGVPIVVATIGIVRVLGPRVLPQRAAASIPANLGDHARTLASQYALGDEGIRLRIEAGSSLVGRSPASLRDDMPRDVTLIGVQGSREARGDHDPIRVGDLLSLRGDHDGARAWGAVHELVGDQSDTGAPEDVLDREVGVAEVVIPPRSPFVGTAVFPGMVTFSGDFVVLAVQRNGRSRPSETTVLAVGDTLILRGTWEALERGVAREHGVIVVDAPATVRRQAIPMGMGARRAIAIMVGMVVLLATGIVPAAAAALLAAGAMVLNGVVTMGRAYRAISWTTVVLVAAMIPLSQAVTDSGAADLVADLLVDVVGDAGPYALLLGVFLVTAVFSQLISNMATALIVIPVAVTAANDVGVSARPVLMAVTIAAAAAFVTPVATPANLMVMGPGGYEFGDYWKLGLPLLGLFMVAAVFLVPVFFPF